MISRLQELFLELASSHPLALSFLGPLLGGEPFFVILAFLSGTTGLLPLWLLYIGGSFADFADDMFWFYFSRSKLLHKIPLSRSIKKFYKKENRKFRKFENKELTLFMLTSKFLIGTRIAAVFSISTNKVKLSKFMLSSLISAYIWGLIIIGLGWSVGMGYLFFIRFFRGVRYSLTILILFAIAVFIFRHYLHRFAIKSLIK